MIGNVIGTTSEIPDKVSQLENDAGYGTQKGIDAALEVANSALFERIVIASSNGLAFKNGEGSTIIAAAVYRGSTSITNDVTLKWKQDGTEVATGVNYITVEGSSVSEKSIVTVEAYDENNKLLTVESVTLLDVFDGAQGLQGIQGKQGIQGIQGEPGAQGKSSYFHIKYSTVPNPASANEMTESPSEYIGTYVDFSPTDSTDPAAYTWCRFQGIQGEKGETGIPGKNGTDGKTYYLHIAYATSFDGTKDFSVSDPVGKTYIGQYTDINTVDSTDPTKYKWSRIKGETGATGVSIASTVDEWYLSTSNESPVGGSWAELREAWSEGHYYWRRVKTSYSDGTTGYTPSELGYYDAAITTAVSNSNEARSTAGNAVNTANAAKSTADSASTTAGQAKSTAETAKSTAETAKSTADSAKTSADTNARDLANYITKNTSALEQMQTLIDGSIMTWFFPRPPADTNEPTSKWTTTDLKNQHLGDLYYDTDTGYCYRYQVEHQVYSWQRITDVDVTKALADAKNAQDTADGKRRVFTLQPTPPYDVGDLWAAGANGDIKRCRIAKTSEQSYAASDWELASKYTDDTTANAAKSTADNANSKIDNLKVGGRNLALNSAKLDKTPKKGNRYAGPRLSSELVVNRGDGFSEVRATQIWSGIQVFANDYNFKAGDELVFSANVEPVGEKMRVGFWAICYERDGATRINNTLYIDDSDYLTHNKMFGVFEAGTSRRVSVRIKWTDKAVDIINNGGYVSLTFELATDLASESSYLSIYAPKLELGNKATDWTPAPEDIDATTDQLRDDLNSTESALNTQITEVSKKTDSTNSALNEARDELSKRIADTMAQAQMAAAAAKVAQTDLDNYKSMTVDPQLKTMSDFMAKYNLSFRQDSTGLYITNQNADGTTADISLRLGNDRISFIQGTGDAAYEVAFISNNQLYITSGEFLKGLRLGNYALIPGANGNLSCKKVK